MALLIWYQFCVSFLFLSFFLSLNFSGKERGLEQSAMSLWQPDPVTLLSSYFCRPYIWSLFYSGTFSNLQLSCVLSAQEERGNFSPRPALASGALWDGLHLGQVPGERGSE